MGYFLYIGGMFVLLQYSVFDLRIRNNPEFLTIPFKTWPHIEDGFRFVNNFGRIREKDEKELFNWVLEEHHAYVEVNSLKFEDLQTIGDPFTIQGDHRRIYFDDYGGIRLCIGFDIRMKQGHSVEKLEDLIQHLSKKKIRIKSPEKRTKSVQLDNLTASFKNLFVYSISQKDHISQAKHLSKSQAPQVQVHLSEEEFERFDRLNSFHQYLLDPQAFLYYKSLDIGKRQVDCVVTFGEQEVEKKQFSRYALGHLFGLEEDLESLLEFQNSDISLGADAKTSFSKLREDYLNGGRLDEWQEINDIYQEIAGNRYERLKEAHENKFIPSSSKKVQANKTEMESSIRNLIISGEFEEALDKMELMASPQNLNRVYVPRATYNKYEQELAQGILSHDQKQQRFSIVVTDSLNFLTFLVKQRVGESQEVAHTPQVTKEKKDLDSPKKYSLLIPKRIGNIWKI